MSLLACLCFPFWFTDSTLIWTLGFRQTYDWFPREIYYTATTDQVTQYKDRMPQDEEKTGNYESILDNNHKSRVPNPDALSQKNVKDHFNTFQKQMDDQLKKRLDEFLKQIPARQWMTSPVSGMVSCFLCLFSLFLSKIYSIVSMAYAYGEYVVYTWTVNRSTRTPTSERTHSRRI